MDHDFTPEKSRDTPRKHRKGLTRTAAACERCRRRKQKCDSKLPICGPCGAVGAACIMSDRLLVQPNSQCDCDTLRNQVTELQGCIENLKIELSREKEKVPESLITPVTSTGNFYSEQFPLPTQSQVQPVVSENGSSEHKAYSGRILRPTFVSGSRRRAVGADILGSAWQLWYNDSSTETPSQPTTSVNDVPISEYGEELIKVFFDSYWAHLPILHRPTFMEQHYYPVSQGMTLGRELSVFQVYLVCAIAACEKPRVNGYVISHHELFQKGIEELATIMQSSDLDCIQCLLLLCMYGRNEPQSINLWHTTGLALRTALGIDLHRQEAIAGDSLLQAEMAKRLFWSAYVMDRSMSMAMGRPLGIEDSAITIELPLQYTDEQIANPEMIAKMQTSIPSTKDTSTFIHVIKIRRINANVYKTFHSAGHSQPSESLEALRHEYYEQLNQWLITAPRYLLTTSMFQSAEWFQIAYHHAILSLHRPTYACPVPSFDALRLCADSSISLISSYASLYAKNKVSYSFIALNSIFMAAISMLYALRASPYLRQELSKSVLQANISSCLSLFRGISNGREIAERCAGIVSRLGEATLALFDKPQSSDSQVDGEFLSWFGLKSHQSALPIVQPHIEGPPDAWQDQSLEFPDPMSLPSIDIPWQDFFDQDLNWEGLAATDLFPLPLE